MMGRSRYLFSLAGTACVAVSSYLMAGMSTTSTSLASLDSPSAALSTVEAPQVSTTEQPTAQNPGAAAECQLPEIPRQARLFPANLTTLVGGDQLMIRVSRGQLKVTAADLAAVAASVSLTMWPEGTTVDIEARPAIVDGGGELRIVSTTELSDGWYRLARWQLWREGLAVPSRLGAGPAAGVDLRQGRRTLQGGTGVFRAARSVFGRGLRFGGRHREEAGLQPGIARRSCTRASHAAAPSGAGRHHGSCSAQGGASAHFRLPRHRRPARPQAAKSQRKSRKLWPCLDARSAGLAQGAFQAGGATLHEAGPRNAAIFGGQAVRP
jgi:hypothetical protein